MVTRPAATSATEGVARPPEPVPWRRYRRSRRRRRPLRPRPAPAAPSGGCLSMTDDASRRRPPGRPVILDRCGGRDTSWPVRCPRSGPSVVLGQAGASHLEATLRGATPPAPASFGVSRSTPRLVVATPATSPLPKRHCPRRNNDRAIGRVGVAVPAGLGSAAGPHVPGAARDAGETAAVRSDIGSVGSSTILCTRSSRALPRPMSRVATESDSCATASRRSTP